MDAKSFIIIGAVIAATLIVVPAVAFKAYYPLGSWHEDRWSYHEGWNYKDYNVNITGSANLYAAIKEFIEENRKIDFIGASVIAENALTDMKVIKGEFGTVQGYLTYTFHGISIDGNQTIKQYAIIDAGNGEILYTSEPITSIKYGKYYENITNAKLDMFEAAAIANKELPEASVEYGALKVYGDTLAYSFILKDDDKRYSVLIDANSGEVLKVSEITKYKKHGWH
ncbi:MAG: hypothetical protein KatS3mg003_1376 [Candidatus Nitrosocaldaceae archaeon]|nr:MAG: hypothetical protein KatS3mg003_1376 [Candidatus Nitrosocaldaceae archaeon]